MMEILRYNRKEAETYHADSLADLKDLGGWDEEPVHWLNICIDNTELVHQIADFYKIHSLTTEDILNVQHLPKFEAFEDYYFFTLKYLQYDKEQGTSIRHISLILKEGLLLSFHENSNNPVFVYVKERIIQNAGNLRSLKADHLFYRLIDLIVDDYLSISNMIREEIEELDTIAYEGTDEDITGNILDIKREISTIRRISIPLRDELGRLRTNPSGLLRKTTLVYFQDVADHVNHLLSSLENFRDVLKDQMDLHLSQLSHSMNQVMKTLTVVASIFIPLTFIAGVYGMNFEYIPELDWKYAYPAFWLFCVILAAVMIIYMKKKRWF